MLLMSIAIIDDQNHALEQLAKANRKSLQDLKFQPFLTPLSQNCLPILKSNLRFRNFLRLSMNILMQTVLIFSKTISQKILPEILMST